MNASRNASLSQHVKQTSSAASSPRTPQRQTASPAAGSPRARRTQTPPAKKCQGRDISTAKVQRGPVASPAKPRSMLKKVSCACTLAPSAATVCVCRRCSQRTASRTRQRPPCSLACNALCPAACRAVRSLGWPLCSTLCPTPLSLQENSPEVRSEVVFTTPPRPEAPPGEMVPDAPTEAPVEGFVTPTREDPEAPPRMLSERQS